MKQTFKTLGQGLLNILFPQTCLFCQREGGLLCEDCRAGFDVLKENFCLCQKPKLLPRAGKCSQCRAKSLEGLYFPFFYEDPRVKHLIRVFKYEPFLKGLAQPLSSFILTYFFLKEQKTFPHFDLLCRGDTKQKKAEFVLVPIPLSRKRLRWRGFNQAKEIAKYLAAHWKISLISDCLFKIKKTPPQAELSRKERKEKIKGAFLVKNSEKIQGKKIFLVDDVYTTGSTMEEAAKVLKEAGAKEVWGIAVARATKT